MSYAERSTEIQDKITTHAAGLAECALELSELVCDMANKIESLRDTLRTIEERQYLRSAFGD